MSHPPSAEGIVLVDFDGTLFPWGSLSAPLEPLPGAAEAMDLLVRCGYKPVIFTSRLSRSWHAAEGRDPERGISDQRRIIANALFRHRMPQYPMTAEKIPAVLYLDDKAMRVSAGRPLLEAVLTFIAKGDAAL